MRMIGLGLLGFLLAGIALLLTTFNIMDKGRHFFDQLSTDTELVFEDRRAVPVADENTARIYRSNPNHPVILSGLPAYQSVSFNLPLDARPTSGYLQIEATFQVLEGVEGVLRISIDGTRRGEMLLRSGEVGRSLRILLSPTDFARSQLVVSFSLQGGAPQSQCAKGDDLAAVVEIETTSAVFLTVDRPLETPRDRIRTWGEVVRVGWPHWLVREEQMRRLILATQFKQAGLETVMIDAHSEDALSTVELRDALAFEVDFVETVDIFSSLGAAGANAGVRKFQTETSWRLRYDLRADGATRFPSVLDLQLALGRQFDGGQWSVVVTLNNRLIHQSVVQADQTELSERIILPQVMQSALNVIEIAAISTGQHQSPCIEGPELIAEMLSGTRLVPGEAVFGDALTELRFALSEIGSLTVGTFSNLTAADADLGTTFLAEIVPSDVTLRPGIQQAQIVMLPPAANIGLPEGSPFWMVTRDPITQDISITAHEQATLPERAGFAILIIPAALDLGGQRL